AELPPTVASRLTDFARAPEPLFRAHELYDRIAQIGDNLAAEATRLVRLADFAEKLDRGLAMEAVRLIARAEQAEAQVEVAELEKRLQARPIAEVLVALLEREGSDLVAAQFLEHAAAAGAAALHAWCVAAADVLLAAQRKVEPRLIVLLIHQLARAAELDRVLMLLVRFRRELAGASLALPAHAPAPLQTYLDAQFGRGRTRAVGRAAGVLRAAADLQPLVKSDAATRLLAEAAVEAVHAAQQALTLTPEDVQALRELQNAIDAVPVSVTWIYDLSAQLLTVRFLEYATHDADVDAAMKRQATLLTPEALAAVAASLLVAAAQKGPAHERSVRAARAAIQTLGAGALTERLPAVLQHLGVGQLTLWELPGLEDVLSLLGDSARMAGDTRRLALALKRIHAEPSALGDVAAAVLQLRSAGARITGTEKTLEPIVSALRTTRPAAGSNGATLELALELLATVAEPTALRAIEDAVLGHAHGVTIRLRRLDRAVLQCQSACDEALYDALVRGLET
ncbi:MAG: hypothetical protein ACRENP_30480, partial [Longimicrobiales bacterium]